MNAILLVAAVLALVSGALLLRLCLAGRPVRGESLMGFHLVTAPLALAQAVSMLLGLLVHGVEPAWFAWLAYATLPGHALAVVMLPFACYGRRNVGVAKGLMVLVVLASGLLVAGPLLAPWATVAGAAVGVGYGGITTLMVAWWLLGRRLLRLLPRRRTKSPDDFESRQGAWQREQWEKLPPNPTVVQLLGFVRAFDPEVRRSCLQRLGAVPDLGAQLDAVLRQPYDTDAPFYLVHHGVTVRAQVAGGLTVLLDRQLADARVRLRESRGEAQPFLGNFVGALDAGVAVLQAGGKVREPLQRWCEFLQQVPSQQPLGRRLSRYLR